MSRYSLIRFKQVPQKSRPYVCHAFKLRSPRIPRQLPLFSHGHLDQEPFYMTLNYTQYTLSDYINSLHIALQND